MRVVAARILVGDPIVALANRRGKRTHPRLNLTSLKNYRDVVFVRNPPISRKFAEQVGECRSGGQERRPNLPLFEHALPSRLGLGQDQVLANPARAVEIVTVIYYDLPLGIHPPGVHSIDEIASPGIDRENRLRARLL